MPPRRFRVLTAVTVAIVMHLAASGSAYAHGKDINIAVACTAPDPVRPLAKVCTAFLRYPDGDPVSDALFQIAAVRSTGAATALGPFIFKPLAERGAYSVAVIFPAYGTWKMRFAVLQPGRGEAELQEELLPPAAGSGNQIAARLQLVLDFGLVDLRNLAIRIVHLLASAVWFGLVSLVLAVSVFLSPEQRMPQLRRLARAFPWVAGASLLVTGVSGAANALYNTPARSPGLFAPEVLARLPFGRVYVGVFLGKMVLMAGILIATVALGAVIRVGQSNRTLVRVRRLAAVNVGLGLAVFAWVIVLGYMHIIAHVGGALGAR